MPHRDVHPATGAAAGTAVSQIAPLKELKDYKVAKDDPDVRGWNVIGRDGRPVGEVHDLLVDTAAMRVRYLDVELDRDLLAAAPSVPGATGVAGAHPVAGGAKYHVLVPIGSARLDEDHDRIHLEGLDSQDAALLPAYDHHAFGREYESGLRRRFDRSWTPAADRDFYAGELYDEERFYGPRRRRRRIL